MDELETFKELVMIRSRLEGIEHTQEIMVRALAKDIEPFIFEAMDSDPLLLRIYLLVDSQRTQKDIVQALVDAGVPGASQPTVSRRLARLLGELHLVEVADHSAGGKVYQKSAIDRILGLTRKLDRRRARALGEAG